MKSKEALKRITSEINNYKLSGIGDKNWLGIQDVLKDVNILEKALTPPTADEVCEALSDDYKNPVIFDNDTKEFIVTVTHPTVMQYSITEYKNGCVRAQMDYLKPSLITLIGRFYEGLERVGE